jgi:hypothetical protein
LVEHLIPPKHTATAQGERVFFDIDVKGGEKEWSGPDATVGGPNRLAQSFRVCHQCQRGRLLAYLQAGMLVIDGKIRVCSDGKTGTT